MKVAADQVVSIHYQLTNDAQQQIDSSIGGEPLTYLHGHQNLLPALEEALESLEVGAKLEVILPPEDGYGTVQPDLVQSVPRKDLSGIGELTIGTQVQAESSEGVRVLKVVGITDDTVMLDANHPLAGQTLHFQVEIVNVRKASDEELAHGHVHGPGGHHH